MSKKDKEEKIKFTKDQVIGGSRFNYIARGEKDTSSKQSPRASDGQLKFLNSNGFNFTKEELSRVRAKKLIADLKAARKKLDFNN